MGATGTSEQQAEADGIAANNLNPRAR